MKKILFIFFITIIACTACQKEDSNGDLGAYWKIMSIEEHTSGATHNLVNESNFWGIQLDLLEIRKTTDSRYYFRFQHIGDSLFVQGINTKNAELKLWGIYDNTNERYSVQHLDDKSMILNSKNAKITFRSF